jgi:hypothetical protein
MSKTFLNLFEKVALRGSYEQGIYQRLVAAAYRLAPVLDPEAVPLFELLAQKVQHQQKQLSTHYNFQVQPEDPYVGGFQQMFNDLDSQKAAGVRKPTLKVLQTLPPQSHPVVAPQTNDTFRGVHDIIAHYFGRHPFNARGEFAAYNRHLKTLPPAVAPVLFTEIVGQTSAYLVYGDFQEQKAAILHDFDFFQIGLLCPRSPLNRFFLFKDKLLQPATGFTWSVFSQMMPDYAKTLEGQPGFDAAAWENYSANTDPSRRNSNQPVVATEVDSRTFAAALKNAKMVNPHGEYVNDPGDLTDEVCLMSSDGSSGVALSPSKELHYGFSTGQGNPNAFSIVMQEGIRRGGMWGNSFAGPLERTYAKFNFFPVARLKTQPQWMPSDYFKKHPGDSSLPDIVFYRLGAKPTTNIPVVQTFEQGAMLARAGEAR